MTLRKKWARHGGPLRAQQGQTRIYVTAMLGPCTRAAAGRGVIVLLKTLRRSAGSMSERPGTRWARPSYSLLRQKIANSLPRAAKILIYLKASTVHHR